MSRKPLVRECPPTTWYFRQPRYLRYMSREITSIFIAAYCVLLVVGLQRLSQGPAAWEGFLLGHAAWFDGAPARALLDAIRDDA